MTTRENGFPTGGSAFDPGAVGAAGGGGVPVVPTQTDPVTFFTGPVSAPYVLDTAVGGPDQLIFVDNSAGDVPVDLDSSLPTVFTGRVVIVKALTGIVPPFGSALISDSNGGLINGFASASIYSTSSLRLVFDGTDWWAI